MNFDNKSKRSKKILIGVTGCISAYKICDCVREFIKKKHEVKVILTSCSQNFVSPLTLAVLSQNKVHTDIFDLEKGCFPLHIRLADWADVFLVAPLSADVLSKVVAGFSDSLLLNVLLAFTGSVLFCPSMNVHMYQNEIIQKNLEKLREINRYQILDPEEGFLACLSQGQGRLANVEKICRKVESL